MPRKKPTKKTEPKKGKRSTHAVFLARVEAVLRIRLAGAEFHDLREYAKETDAETGRPWDVSDSQLWRYIQASDELLAQTVEKRADRLLNLHLAKRHTLYAHAVQQGDVRAAIGVLKDEAELLNLYPAKRHEHTGRDGGPVEVTVTELVEARRRAAEHRQAKLAAAGVSDAAR